MRLTARGRAVSAAGLVLLVFAALVGFAELDRARGILEPPAGGMPPLYPELQYFPLAGGQGSAPDGTLAGMTSRHR